MITIIATLEVKEGKMEEATELLKEVRKKVRDAEPGCLAYIPHTVKGKKNKNTIVFYEKYESKEAFSDHSQNLPKYFGKLGPLLVPGMDLKTCFEIE
ncbi:MAG: antibiotic biosynthesis monooxygenase [archaeon]|nr:antibiotic biosynthesis monooxygenase [archaeon]